MGAIKSHKTAVDKTAKWNGPAAVAAAPAEAGTLQYMHAWVDGKGDAAKKASYKFPHHEAGTDTPAVIAGVNNALARLAQANIPAGDKTGVEAHLRKHRKDAGLEEAMGEQEVNEAVKFIKDVDDLRNNAYVSLREAVILQETSNLAEWLESRLHLTLTTYADDLFGGGNVTRDERKALSAAIGAALDNYHQVLMDACPQLFQRKPWDSPVENSGQMSEGSAGDDLPPSQPFPRGGEGVLLREEFMPLEEKALRRDGTIPVKLIQPGWGSSGYYPAEVLERDGAKAFPAGTKMFWNHPSLSEEADRPERDLNALASELVTAAKFQANGPKGPGLYADARVFEGYQAAVDDLAGSIGLSIRASGKSQQGTADGRDGPIITELMANEMNTVDYVTYPGAGGAVITMFEAARIGRADKSTEAGAVPASTTATDSVANNESTEVEMDPKELEKLQESLTTLQTSNETLVAKNARMAEALILRDAKDLVQERLGAYPMLPGPTQKRLAESLPLKFVVKEDALDKEAFGKLVDEAVKAEVAYLVEVTGMGSIKGLGESAGDADDDKPDKVEESLEQSFQDMGLSEKASKTAAKGRG